MTGVIAPLRVFVILSAKSPLILNILNILLEHVCVGLFRKQLADNFYLCGSYCEAWKRRYDVQGILTSMATRSGLYLVGPSMFFNSTMSSNTHPGYVRTSDSTIK